MFEEVQLAGIKDKDGNDVYFVADQLFVKYVVENVNGVEKTAIKDIVIVESKLKDATNVSKRQSDVITSIFNANGSKNNDFTGFNVKSRYRACKTESSEKLNQKVKKLKFDGDVTFIKAFDFDDGNALNDVRNMTINDKITY